MIGNKKFCITKQRNTYCLYRRIHNSVGEVIKEILVFETAELSKVINKLVQQMKKNKREYEQHH